MPSTSHPAADLAAAASAAAGLIHAAAAGSHAELTTLSRLFAVTAVLQIGWAAAVLARRTRPVVLAGVAVNGAALVAWGATRRAGISSIEGLEVAQGVGFADGLAATAAALAVLAGVLSLTAVTVPSPVRVATPIVVGVLVLAAVPAMATPHDHDSHAHDEVASDHAHDDGHDDAHDDEGHEDEADHAHDDEARADDSGTDVPTDAELGYPASFVSWLDQAETPEARARAERLLVETTEAMQAFPDEAAVQAAGFVSIGDGATGWEHYINVERIVNPAVLDPSDIESVVFKVHPDGTKEVASAMYLLPFGATMADAPDVAGDLTVWHDHQNLCWDGVRVVGTTDATGSCVRGQFRPTQPMMHVWVIEHPCGPFAGIEGSHGSGCAHDHADEAADEEVAASDDHPHAPGTPEHQD